MERRIRRWTLSFLAALALSLGAGCGGGGGPGENNDDGGGGGSTSLQGTWFGTHLDPSSVLHTIQVTVDANGNITSFLLDGSDTGITGSTSHESGQIYAFLLSNGVSGGFLVDSSDMYATLVDENFGFSVVQRGASSLPGGGYSTSDVYSSSWSGFTVLTTEDFEVKDVLTSTVTVDGNGTFTETSSANITSTTDTEALDLLSGTYGVYGGDFENTQGASGSVFIFLSVDKEYAGSFACWGAFPGECAFHSWRRQ